jgi:acyl-coenzyme A thioesterase PaaI-like protein
VSDSHALLRDNLYRAYRGSIPFNEWMGARYRRAGPESAEVFVPWRQSLCDDSGRISEGMLAAIADMAAGQGAMGISGWRVQAATSSLVYSKTGDLPSGQGVDAHARPVFHDADTMLVDIALHPQDMPELAIRRARARMVIVRRLDPGDPFDPPVSADHPDGFSAFSEVLGATVSVKEDEIEVVVPARKFYMGNSNRSALHGGLVCSVLFEGIERLLAQDGRRAELLDSTTEFLESARETEMIVQARIRRAGRRLAFFEARLVQDIDGHGRTRIAQRNATMSFQQE